MLQILGDTKNVSRICQHIEKEFSGKILLELRDQRTLDLKSKDGKGIIQGYLDEIKLNERQTNVYRVLNEIITHANYASVYVVGEKERQNCVFGGWRGFKFNDGRPSCNTVDLDDALSFERKTGGVISATGFVLHEFYETYLDQLQGINEYVEAHRRATGIQNTIDNITIEVENGGHLINLKTQNGVIYTFFKNANGERYTYKSVIKKMLIGDVMKIDGYFGKNKDGKEVLFFPKVDKKG